MFHISNLISLFEIKQFKCGIIMRFMIIISALALADYAVSHVGFVKGGIKKRNWNLISFCSATSSNAIKIFRKLSLKMRICDLNSAYHYLYQAKIKLQQKCQTTQLLKRDAHLPTLFCLHCTKNSPLHFFSRKTKPNISLYFA